MKSMNPQKSFFNAILLLVFVMAMSFFSSCSSCGKTQPNVDSSNADTLNIPGLSTINAAIASDSLNPMLYLKRAKIYEANQQLKSAITDMYVALVLDSLQPEFYLYTADLFKKTYEPQRGIALMDKAISIDSANVNYYVKAAELAYIDTTIKGNYKLALDYLNAAIKIDMQQADIYFYKGNIYRETGDTAKAISSYQTATELNPKFYDAYVQIGLLLKQSKNPNAEKYLDNAIKVSDKPEDALYAKANILKEQAVAFQNVGKNDQATANFTKAIETFRKVVEVNHSNTEAFMGIAFSYYQMDSVQQAYKYYDLATKMAPTYAGAYFSKGLCAEELGRTSEAITLYQNCLNIDPDFTRAREHLRALQQAQ